MGTISQLSIHFKVFSLLNFDGCSTSAGLLEPFPSFELAQLFVKLLPTISESNPLSRPTTADFESSTRMEDELLAVRAIEVGALKIGLVSMPTGGLQRA
jgi:hypothetical protein